MPSRKLNDERLKGRKRDLLTKPVREIDLEKAISIEALVEGFQGASIQARSLGEVARVYERMIADTDRPTIILGLAGPLIAAGLRKVIRDLIHNGLVDCIVSTGAILYQDYYQSKGYQHFRGTPSADDADLRKLLVDRIYDTYVDEEKFSLLDAEIGKLADELPAGEYSSRTFINELSKDIKDPNSILGTARRLGIPIFSPALNDSSIGIGLTEHHHRMRKEGPSL